MKIAVASPEEVLFENGVTVGILGMRRSLFDTMLNLLQTSGTMDATSQSTMFVVFITIYFRSGYFEGYKFQWNKTMDPRLAGILINSISLYTFLRARI